MKYVLLILTLSTFIACKGKKEKPQPEPDIFETRACDYTLPDGYKMLCHDKRNIYLIQINDTNYLSKQDRKNNGQSYYIILDFRVSKKLTGYIYFNDFNHAIKFEDSCQAKGYVKQLLLEKEEDRINDSIRVAKIISEHIADSIKQEEETLKHFKKCIK